MRRSVSVEKPEHLSSLSRQWRAVRQRHGKGQAFAPLQHLNGVAPLSSAPRIILASATARVRSPPPGAGRQGRLGVDVAHYEV
jgi:hypothetical protein